MVFLNLFKRIPENPAPANSVSSIPSSPALTDAEIMLLEYCTYGSYPHPKNGYPQFWEREFHMLDVDHALASLETRGYIEFCPALDMLPRLTIAQLKDIAKKNGIAVSGKKADILAMVSSISPVSLEKTVTNRKYRLTDKGRAVWQENSAVIFAYKNSAMGIDVDCVRNDSLHRSAHDLAWADLNRQCSNAIAASQWGVYRNAKFSMADICLSEKRFLLSISIYAEVFWLDINDSPPFVAPGLVSRMQTCVCHTELDREKLFSLVADSFSDAPHENVDSNDACGIITSLVFHDYDVAKKALLQYPEIQLSFFDKLK